jgi:alkylation response protein AidB-like acyl-CoA dehydrogenase
MSPFAIDKRDIQFCLFEYLNMEQLIKLPEYSEFSREVFDSVLDEAIRFAAGKIAPLNIVMDREGLKFDKGKVYFPRGHNEVFNAYREGGWVAMSSSPEYGGQGMPAVLSIAVLEMHISASVAYMMMPGLTQAAGHVIESYGTDDQKKTYCEKLYTGIWGGTMCLTESGAGSAVGDAKTKAKRNGDHYLIEGEKIFITAGDHDATENIVHLVLARIEGAPRGMKGISLFIVPKFLVNQDGSVGAANNVACGNIEHKMGIHGSPTCTMVFGADGPCKGFLIGEESAGIKYMFMMMNEARIGVGLQGAAAASASYMEALQYARERIQGVEAAHMKNADAPRVPIIKHPDVKRMLLTMKAFTEGFRALLYATTMSLDLSFKHPDKDEREKHADLGSLLTPVCKAFCSDMGFRMTEIGMQVLGGYGYTREYPLEQYCRDAKIASIYEGTNGIQALDLLGRKMREKGGMVFMRFMMMVNELVDSNRNHPTCGKYVQSLEKARDELVSVMTHLQQVGMGGDIDGFILQATPVMDLFGTFILAYHLIGQALVADRKFSAIATAKGATTPDGQKNLIAENSEARFYANKLHSMKFYVDTYLPHVYSIGMAIKNANRSPLEIEF